MAHFKFLLDRSVKSLTPCFPDKRVETTESIGLPEDAPDETVVAEASTGKFLLVAAIRATEPFEQFSQRVAEYFLEKLNGLRVVF